jgi:FAD:protein FMN transferase
MWLDAALATSGTYERGPHLVDPHTGRPGARAASASVTGTDLGLVDALATALAVGGDDAFERITATGTTDAYLVRADGSERRTAGFPFGD